MADGKASKLGHVQRAVRVVANDTAAHDEDARSLGGFYQLAEIGFPVALAFFYVNTQNRPHVGRHRTYRAIRCKACHKGQWLGTLVMQVVQIPGLPLQRQSGCLQQIHARARL